MTSAAEDNEVTITASRHWMWGSLRELWTYRELLYFLTWRDVKVRYKQTAFGAGWAILQPLLLMLVFTAFFGQLVRVPSDGVPYPLFAYIALVPWTLFAQSFSGASLSLIANAHLVSKIYFPRLLLPLASIGSFLLDFLIAFSLLAGMMILYDVQLTSRILWLPAFTGLAVMSALAVGIWLAAVNARYRDVQHAVPFILQVWLFASPVVYPISLVPPQWQGLYSLNPMAGVVEGFRWSLLNTAALQSSTILISAAASVIVLVSGIIYFQRVERAFADVI